MLPPADHAQRKGLEGTRGPALLLASLIRSHLPKIHTGARLGRNDNLVADIRRVAMILYLCTQKGAPLLLSSKGEFTSPLLESGLVFLLWPQKV